MLVVSRALIPLIELLRLPTLFSLRKKGFFGCGLACFPPPSLPVSISSSNWGSIDSTLPSKTWIFVEWSYQGTGELQGIHCALKSLTCRRVVLVHLIGDAMPFRVLKLAPASLPLRGPGALVGLLRAASRQKTTLKHRAHGSLLSNCNSN